MRYPNRRRWLLDPLERRTHLSVARPSYNTGTGFFVSGGRIYDANGELFVMKGPNMNHAWGSYNANYLAIDQIAKTGANAVRAVMYQDIVADGTNNWTDSADTPARRKAVVERYLANGLTVVVEDHASIQDSSSQSSTTALNEIVTHWLDNAVWLKQYERGVILNIANEWGPVVGASGSNTTWRDAYISQVQRLRRGPDGTLGTADDITNLLMVDASGWGQDFNSLSLHAQAIQDADPQHNVVFSIHLYGQWRDELRSYDVPGGNSDYGPWDIRSRLLSLQNRATPLPLVIGEWAWEDFRDFSNSSAPYSYYRTRRTMEIADELGIGMLGWSWNGSSPTTLNMTAGAIGNVNYNSNADISDWGNAVINDPQFGWKATAKRATVFPITGLPAAPSGLPAMPSAALPASQLLIDSTTISVPEGGQAMARVRLSQAPTASVAVTVAKTSGDGDLNLLTESLTFTPTNWNIWQSVFLSASPDADTSAGTARFGLFASGFTSTDFAAREIDHTTPTGTTTLSPVADRAYSGQTTSASVSISTTTTPQPTGAFFLRFNLASLGGKVSNAVLRLYKTVATTNRIVRVHAVYDDAWTDSTGTNATRGIHAPYPITTATTPNVANTYFDVDVTDFVREQQLKDGVVSLAITTTTGTLSFNARESATNAPQLVVSAVEAIAPSVTAATFDYTTSPNAIEFAFSEDVSASLASADVRLESLTNPGTALTLSNPVYNAATNVARFTVAPGVVPDGRYRATLVSTGVSDAAGNAVLVDRALDFFSLAGDANRDGTVNFDDLLILAANYNASPVGFVDGDFDYSGTVDFDDLLIIASRYNTSIASDLLA
jgi:mannan endo-1,4-beta-mannosidase